MNDKSFIVNGKYNTKFGPNIELHGLYKTDKDEECDKKDIEPIFEKQEDYTIFTPHFIAHKDEILSSLSKTVYCYNYDKSILDTFYQNHEDFVFKIDNKDFDDMVDVFVDFDYHMERFETCIIDLGLEEYERKIWKHMGRTLVAETIGRRFVFVYLYKYDSLIYQYFTYLISLDSFAEIEPTDIFDGNNYKLTGCEYVK